MNILKDGFYLRAILSTRPHDDAVVLCVYKAKLPFRQVTRIKEVSFNDAVRIIPQKIIDDLRPIGDGVVYAQSPVPSGDPLSMLALSYA